MKPWAVAHRGYSYRYPENSFVAFDKACDIKMDGIELDLQLSRDEEVMVYHDHYLGKVAHPHLRVCDWNKAQLKKMDVGSWFDRRFANERMPDLDEVLEAYGHRTHLLLEIKSDNLKGSDPRFDILTDKVVEAVKRHGLEERVYILCFNRAVLQRAFLRCPQIKRVWNLMKLASYCSGLSALSIDINAVDDPCVKYLQERQQNLITWTCNEEEQVKKAIEAGAQMILSDKAEWLKDLLS